MDKLCKPPATWIMLSRSGVVPPRRFPGEHEISPASGVIGHDVRVLIGAFGDPGHAFPAIALGKALAARGHHVTLETWSRWQGYVEHEGMRFAAAPEYQVFPTKERPLKPYAAAARAAKETQPLVREVDPDVVVNDVLTLAPALAAELEGRRWATLVPHFFPPAAEGLPPYGLGAMPARGVVGRGGWRLVARPMRLGIERGRRELNETRRRVGLPELDRYYGGISQDLCLVGTFPQLEYPRSWPPSVHVVGPLSWEPPVEEVEMPHGEEPLVLVAPSTTQDPEQRVLRAALRGLAGLPLRVLAVYGRRSRERLSVPANARLVEWISYSRAMPRADVIVCHGGHGTLARALASGSPVVTVPAAGDMAENGARAQWAGAGLNVPGRFLSPRALRWAVQAVLEDARFAARARELGRWAGEHDGAATAAALIERFATRASRS
jgi:UDP:flavonoid glycosyltransferase YjiC (YdhE family)